jgi:hypothetical protein
LKVFSCCSQCTFLFINTFFNFWPSLWRLHSKIKVSSNIKIKIKKRTASDWEKWKCTVATESIFLRRFITLVACSSLFNKVATRYAPHAASIKEYTNSHSIQKRKWRWW